MREWQDTIGVRRGCVFFVWCVMSKWVANRGISGQIKYLKCCLCFVLVFYGQFSAIKSFGLSQNSIGRAWQTLQRDELEHKQKGKPKKTVQQERSVSECFIKGFLINLPLWWFSSPSLRNSTHTHPSAMTFSRNSKCPSHLHSNSLRSSLPCMLDFP